GQPLDPAFGGTTRKTSFAHKVLLRFQEKVEPSSRKATNLNLARVDFGRLEHGHTYISTFRVELEERLEPPPQPPRPPAIPEGPGSERDRCPDRRRPRHLVHIDVCRKHDRRPAALGRGGRNARGGLCWQRTDQRWRTHPGPPA